MAFCLQFVLVAKTLVKTVVTTKKEDIEVAMPVEREPWQLPKSIFASRAKRGPQQCDAKDYFDTEKLFSHMFETDWARLMGKVRPSAESCAALTCSAKLCSIRQSGCCINLHYVS